MPLFLDNHFQDHDVFLHMRTQPIIQFDTHQLEQILINLIDNGLRHSSYAHPHAYVEIEIYRAENDVIIDVLDGGCGVSSANLNRLFNPFLLLLSQAQVWVYIYLNHFAKPIKPVYFIFLSMKNLLSRHCACCR